MRTGGGGVGGGLENSFLQKPVFLPAVMIYCLLLHVKIHIGYRHQLIIIVRNASLNFNHIKK